MDADFKYIRNRIREYSKEEMLKMCFNGLENSEDQIMPRWIFFLLIKWTHLHGGFKRNTKLLTQEKFDRIFYLTHKLDSAHISSFIKSGKITESFLILHSQQFYLQTTVYSNKIATQMKLFHSLRSKYDINAEFLSKTGISLLDFIVLMEALWMYCNAEKHIETNFRFFGYINNDFVQDIGARLTNKEITSRFLSLITFDPSNKEVLNSLSTRIRNAHLQPLERTIFTFYPLQLYNGRYRLIDRTILNYSVNYYLYDYLKENDKNFPSEFGYRFEKYIELSILETGLNFETEKELKAKLPKRSNLVDFRLTDENIFIECKAVELQTYTSVNPTDELLYNSLKDSIMKAYFKQLLSVSKSLNPKGENWGVVLTFKEMFLSHFPQLYPLGEGKFKNWDETDHLPPENVFIIDVSTWDKMVRIVKSRQATFSELLKFAKEMNLNHNTKKQSFYMHLDNYDINRTRASYLQDERDLMEEIWRQ